MSLLETSHWASYNKPQSAFGPLIKKVPQIYPWKMLFTESLKQELKLFRSVNVLVEDMVKWTEIISNYQ